MHLFVDSIFDQYYEAQPITLVDIGARWGVDRIWSKIADHLRVVAFEPDPEEYDRLRMGKSPFAVEYLNTALLDESGTATLHVTRSEGSSSMLRPNRSFLDAFPENERFDVVRDVEVEVDTLDRQLAHAGIGGVDFVKVDTQGAELQILHGGADTLSRSVFGIEVEVEFAPMYEGQPLFADVDRHLRDRGFQLFDLKPHFWKREKGRRYGRDRGQMVFGEALYLRDVDDFAAVLSGLADDSKRQQKALRAVSICLLFGYVDYAQAVFELAADLFAEAEVEAFASALERSVTLSTRLPRLPGLGRVATALRVVADRVEPAYHGWAMSGRALGNR